MIPLTSAQEQAAALTTPAIWVHLFELDHPDGAIRLSSLPATKTDPQGRTWIGGALFLDYSEDVQTASLEGATVTATWNFADPELLARARDGKIAGRRFTRLLAWLDDSGDLIGSPVVTFVGRCETPAIDGDIAAPKILLTAESRVILMNRPRLETYTPERQRAYYDPVTQPDTGLDFIAELGDETLEF